MPNLVKGFGQVKKTQTNIIKKYIYRELDRIFWQYVADVKDYSFINIIQTDTDDDDHYHLHHHHDHDDHDDDDDDDDDDNDDDEDDNDHDENQHQHQIISHLSYFNIDELITTLNAGKNKFCIFSTNIQLIKATGWI